VNGDTLVTPAPGLDDQVLGQYLANGNVMFADNQCVLNLVNHFVDGAVSSILIASLDDVSFTITSATAIYSSATLFLCMPSCSGSRYA